VTQVPNLQKLNQLKYRAQGGVLCDHMHNKEKEKLRGQ